MSKDISIMGVVINLRSVHAPSVQETLTKHGCIIKTRLGLHETSDFECQEQGIVILQLDGSDEQISDLKEDLLKIEGVRVDTMKV